MKATQPILMSDAGERWVLDDSPGSEYTLKIEPGRFLAVCFGQDARRPAAKFKHEMLAARRSRLHEFKHYRGDGSKFWTAKPGVDLWFIVPRTAIRLLPEEGHSYVPAEINGVKVTFNVSGGTAPGGWTDWIGSRVSVSVGHPVADLRKVAEVAVRDEAAEKELLAHLAASGDLDERSRWAFRQAVAAGPVAAALVARYKAGDKDLRIFPAPGLTIQSGGRVESVSFVRRASWRAPTAEESRTHPGVERVRVAADSNRARSFIVRFDGGAYRLPPSRVDWVRTAEANGIAIPSVE